MSFHQPLGAVIAVLQAVRNQEAPRLLFLVHCMDWRRAVRRTCLHLADSLLQGQDLILDLQGEIGIHLLLQVLLYFFHLLLPELLGDVEELLHVNIPQALQVRAPSSGM